MVQELPEDRPARPTLGKPSPTLPPTTPVQEDNWLLPHIPMTPGERNNERLCCLYFIYSLAPPADTNGSSSTVNKPPLGSTLLLLLSPTVIPYSIASHFFKRNSSFHKIELYFSSYFTSLYPFSYLYFSPFVI